MRIAQTTRWILELLVATFLWYLIWSWLEMNGVYGSVVFILTNYGATITVGNSQITIYVFGALLLVGFAYVVRDIVNGLIGGLRNSNKEEEKKRQELTNMINKAVADAFEEERKKQKGANPSP